MNIDLARIKANVRQVNPHIKIIPVAAQTGEGLDACYTWVIEQVADNRG